MSLNCKPCSYGAEAFFIDTTASYKPAVWLSSSCSFGLAVLLAVCALAFFRDIGLVFSAGLAGLAGHLYFQGRNYGRKLEHKQGLPVIVDAEGFHSIKEAGDRYTWESLSGITLQRNLPGIARMYADSGKVETLLILHVGPDRVSATINTASWIGRYRSLRKAVEKQCAERSIPFETEWYAGGQKQQGNPPY